MRLKQLEIVTHCYAETHPHYAKLLTAQISSLLLNRPQRCKVILTVCCTPSDELTCSVVRALERDEAMLSVAPLLLGKAMLLRRSVGRNIAAQRTTADVVHFADADYLYGHGLADALVESLPFPFSIVMPDRLGVHKSHEIGDREIERIVPGELFVPDWTTFVPFRTRIVSGGIQIVSREIAHRGYLPDQKRWQSPVEGDRFQNTTEDSRYRKWIGSAGPIALNGPVLYRMRHTESAFESADDRHKRRGEKQLRSRKRGKT